MILRPRESTGAFSATERLVVDRTAGIATLTSTRDGRDAVSLLANFTDRGQSRNIEAGVLVEDQRFAEELTRQFHDAVGAGSFVAV